MRSRKPDTSAIDKRNADIKAKKDEQGKLNKESEFRAASRRFLKNKGQNSLITTKGKYQGLGEK